MESEVAGNFLLSSGYRIPGYMREGNRLSFIFSFIAENKSHFGIDFLLKPIDILYFRNMLGNKASVDLMLVLNVI